MYSACFTWPYTTLTLTLLYIYIGTGSESVATVLVRMNQLVSTIESMYSGKDMYAVCSAVK